MVGLALVTMLVPGLSIMHAGENQCRLFLAVHGDSGAAALGTGAVHMFKRKRVGGGGGGGGGPGRARV